MRQLRQARGTEREQGHDEKLAAQRLSVALGQWFDGESAPGRTALFPGELAGKRPGHPDPALGHEKRLLLGQADLHEPVDLLPEVRLKLDDILGTEGAL